MRITVELAVESGRLCLPLQYNHLIQAAIYAALDSSFATFLHNIGYANGGRNFKLFSFSRLIGKYQLQQGEIRFEGNAKLIVVSPVEQFCQYLVNGLFTDRGFRLGTTVLSVAGLQVDQPKVDGELLKLRLLSPAVAYSTFIKPQGEKYTCYFQPGEKEFTKLVEANLRKKYQALYKKPAPDGEIALNVNKQPKLHVVEYKGYVIKGYSGILVIRGPQELLQMALDAGVGSKNSMGFGCGERVQ